jgi:hypothetical protein
MNLNEFMHGVGIGFELAIGSIAIGVIVTSVRRNWARIWDTVRGRPWTPRRHPISPAASALPLRVRHSQLRAVEARIQPTRKAS